MELNPYFMESVLIAIAEHEGGRQLDHWKGQHTIHNWQLWKRINSVLSLHYAIDARHQHQHFSFVRRNLIFKSSF